MKNLYKILLAFLLFGWLPALAGSITFNIDDYSGSPLTETVKVYYEDYSTHWALLGTTSTGVLTVSMSDGTYNFKAVLKRSAQVITGVVPGTINFQTSKFIVHVKKSDGSNFPGIITYYEDYSAHWSLVGTTGSDGKASIELFPGDHNFKAKKNYTQQTGYLNISTSGTTGTKIFQTAEAISFVKDCDNNNPIAGIDISFEDYSAHWLTVGTTGSDGKASIELFPGTRKFKAKTIRSFEVISMDLALTSTQIEFNPTRVCFTYSGSVKYEDYSCHWIPFPCDTYLFPGTYNFRFDAVQTQIAISGCTMSSTVIIANLKDSYGSPVEGGIAKLHKGGPTILMGTTDVNGRVIYMYNGTVSNARVSMTAPNAGGTEMSAYQNVPTNSVFNE